MGGWVKEWYNALIRFTDMGGCVAVRVRGRILSGRTCCRVRLGHEIKRQVWGKSVWERGVNGSLYSKWASEEKLVALTAVREKVEIQWEWDEDLTVFIISQWESFEDILNKTSRWKHYFKRVRSIECDREKRERQGGSRQVMLEKMQGVRQRVWQEVSRV